MWYEIKILIEAEAQPDIGTAISTLIQAGYKLKTLQCNSVHYTESEVKRRRKAIVNVRDLKGLPRIIMDYVITEDDREFLFPEFKKQCESFAKDSVVRGTLKKLETRHFLDKVRINTWRKGSNAS